VPDDADSDENSRLGFFAKRKKAKPKKTSEGSDPDAHGLEAIQLVEELKAFGLEPAGLKKFTKSLHRLAVTSGVSPEALTNIIKSVNELCEGKKISISQAQKYIDEITSKKNSVVSEIEELKEKKQTLEANLSLKELESSSNKQRLSEYADFKAQLEQHDLSFSDLSRLVSMIKNAASQNYDSSKIVKLLADMQSQSSKKDQMEKEIENLSDTKRALRERLDALEQEISTKQKIISSAEGLKKFGFGFQELERLQSAIKMIAETRNVELVDAKDHLLSDLEKYYANDHELRKRVRILESLLEEKEEKFKLLEADYQNERAVLESTKKLISEGFDAQWLEKLQALIRLYGTDLDVLSEELKQSKSLKTGIDQLQRTKQALEEEERLLRQKIVVAEDQRIRMLTLIKEMVANSKSGLSPVATNNEKESLTPLGELGELVRAAQGSHDIDERQFKIDTKKAIDTIYKRLPKNSPTRLVLEHALLALYFEEQKKE
jgi:hypothetical protein